MTTMKISIWDRVVLSDLNSSQSDEPIESRPVTCYSVLTWRELSRSEWTLGSLPNRPSRARPGDSEPTQLVGMRCSKGSVERVGIVGVVEVDTWIPGT
jgi:hypothetical protein